VWAVGQAVIVHRVSASWQSTAVGGDHFAVWGSAADDVWMVGCDTTAARCGFIKHNLVKMTTPAADALYGVWGSGPSDVFTVGKGGVILHWDGISWVTEPSGSTADLRAVWGDGGEVFAVGAGGTILHRY